MAVSPVVNKMLGDIVEQRLAFLLPYKDAVLHVPNLHLCKAHWTRKKGKASGQPLGDLTCVDGTPINTPTMSEAAAHCGAINYPTIEDIATMICDFCASVLSSHHSERRPSELCRTTSVPCHALGHEGTTVGQPVLERRRVGKAHGIPRMH